MCQVIQFPQKIVNDLIEVSRSPHETLYVCPNCAARIVARTLWVDAEIDCRCGTRMEAK